MLQLHVTLLWLLGLNLQPLRPKQTGQPDGMPSLVLLQIVAFHTCGRPQEAQALPQIHHTFTLEPAVKSFGCLPLFLLWIPLRCHLRMGLSK